MRTPRFGSHKRRPFDSEIEKKWPGDKPKKTHFWSPKTAINRSQKMCPKSTTILLFTTSLPSCCSPGWSRGAKITPQGAPRMPKWSQNPLFFGGVLGAISIKKAFKNQCTNLCRKGIYGILWENATRMMPKRGPKSMTNLWNFGTCDFLFFVKSINVKIVFLHDQGYQKSIKSRSKIYANSMFEQVMQKTWTMFENGIEMVPQIE